MNVVLADCKFPIPYLDDVLSDSCDSWKIRDYGFTLSKEICEFFFCLKLSILDKFFDRNGKWLNPLRAEAVIGMPPLTNITHLQAYLGLVNHYQSYMQNICDLRTPLNNLLKKGCKMELVKKIVKTHLMTIKKI